MPMNGAGDSRCRGIGPRVADAALLEVPPSLAAALVQQVLDRGEVDIRRARRQACLHLSLVPLDQAPIDPPRVDRKIRHLRLVATAAQQWEEDPGGCSPWACRSGTPHTPVQGRAA